MTSFVHRRLHKGRCRRDSSRSVLLGLALTCAGGIGQIQANTCVTTSACLADETHTGCDLAAAASWKRCGGGTPVAGDQWILAQGHTAIVRSAVTMPGGGTVEGTLVWDSSPNWRTAGFGDL